MGKPMPGIDLAVIDDEGNELPRGEEGEVAIRVKPIAHWVCLKAIAKPGENRRCFVGDWYKTRNRAVVDEDGYFWFVGRSDDVILSAGYRIGPFEVESALIEHPAVAESAVVSVPIRTGARLLRPSLYSPGTTGSDDLIKALQNHCKTRVTAPVQISAKD